MFSESISVVESELAFNAKGAKIVRLEPAAA